VATACGSGADGDILGEEYTSAAGGFTLRQINGYLFQDHGGIISMSAPDAEGELGPMILVMGGTTEIEKDNKTLLEEIIADTDMMTFSKGKKLTVNGTRGLIAEGDAEFDGTQVAGELFAAMVNSTQSFSLLGYAPAERWKELRPLITAVLSSVSFFEPYGDAASLPYDPETSPSMEVVGDGLTYQWASSAMASSEYSDTDWSAWQAVGAPDVEDCGENPNAWAALYGDTEEWIELTYDIPVVPTEINIYQSNNPSQVVEVQIVDVNGDTYVAWTGEPETVADCPDLMTISIELYEEIYVDTIVIFVDQSAAGWGWVEIDAVEMVGRSSLPSASQAESGGEAPANAPSSLPDPSSLSPNTFTFTVSGYENDIIQSNLTQNQSTDNSFVVGMYNESQRYIVSLFIPKDDLKQGSIPLKAYDQTLASKGYTAAIYINGFLYIATDGELNIQSDPASGKLTASYTFNAQSKDFADRAVTVIGALKDVPLN
jgi:hypothetical protein